MCIWEIKRIQSRRHTQASRIDAPCERSSRHRALRNTRRWPAAWSPSGTPLGLDPGRQSDAGKGGRQAESSAVSHRPHPRGRGQRSSPNSQWWAWRRTIFTSETASYFGLETDMLSSPDAQRHSSLPAQSSQSHKVDLWSWIITPLHNGVEKGKRFNIIVAKTFFFFKPRLCAAWRYWKTQQLHLIWPM